jgi:hypothetical protein
LTNLVTETHVNRAKFAEADMQLLVDFVLPALRTGKFHQVYALKLWLESSVGISWLTVCAVFVTD